MKALSRKCTAFLLSLTLLLTLAPTALASEALGDDLDLHSTTLNRGAELGEGTFWSNTFSDLRQENYVVYTPNTSVTPIVTYGDYTTATSTVSAAARKLEEQGLRVVAGINGDYYDTLNGAPLGTVMTDGVLRVASASNYAVGFRADGTAILGAPALAMQVESANTSFSIAAVNQVRYSYGGIYLYTYDFNARRSTGTNAAGYDVVCSAVDGRLSIGESRHRRARGQIRPDGEPPLRRGEPCSAARACGRRHADRHRPRGGRGLERRGLHDRRALSARGERRGLQGA